MKRIAFIGTGIMGAPMAARLARAGFEVRAWNRSAEKLAPLSEYGVLAAATAAEAAAEAEVAIIMVSNGAVCDEVLFAEGTGVASTLKPGSVIVVMSSIAVGAARAQSDRLASLGLNYVDAPVSGGERGAIAGDLTIMAGGDPAVVGSLATVFAPLGRVTHVGPTGCGQLAKLANQLIVGVTIGAVSEALLLAEAGGADPRAVLGALLGGFAESTVLRQHGARMVERQFTPGAHATTQLKDLRTISEQAAEVGLALPFAALACEKFREMCSGPRASLDHSALFLEMRAAHPALFP